MTDAPNSAGNESEPGSPFTRPGFLVAAAVVLVLIVLAGFLVFTGGEEDQQTTPVDPSMIAESTGASGSGQPEGGPAGGEVCVLQADDQTVPLTAPDTEWTLVGTVAAPSSADAGPAATDPATGVRSCYAQTPTGALFAAANFLAAVNAPETLVAAVDELTAAGTGRDTLLELAQSNPTAVLGSGTGFQIAGYTFLSSVPSGASLSLAIGNSGGLAQVPLNVVWEDGDWKVDLPADGNITRAATPITSLSGYVPWAGA